MKATFQGLKYNIKFILESRKDKKTDEKIAKDIPILLSVTFNGKRMFHNVGFRTDRDIWEVGDMYAFQKKNTFNKDGISAAIINASIRNHAAAVDKIFSRLEEYPSVAELRNFLKEELKSPGQISRNDNSIVYYIDKYIQAKSGIVSPARLKQYKTFKNLLKNYVNEKVSKITMNNISLSTIIDFDKYLRSDPESPRSQNTISGIHKRFKAFLNYGVKQGWTRTNPYENFKIEKEVYGDPVFLTKGELDILFNKEIKDERLARVRDVFCLQCFVGARVGDFTRLKHNNIIEGSTQYIPSKTADEKATVCKIPLTKKAWEIINRYDIPGGDLVPYISSQKYNDYLKELFRFCELYRKVAILNPVTRKTEIVKLSDIASSHLARKTFIGILFKHAKNEVIASMSGHVQGSRAFRRYYGITQDDREDAIKNLE